MIEVQKIKEKVELKDMEVNADRCKYYWTQYQIPGREDCLKDCGTWPFQDAYASDRY